MSITRPLRLPNVSNVGYNRTATIGMPVGVHTYEQVVLSLKDINKNEISNIEVRVNGKPIQSWKSVDDLENINDYYRYHITLAETAQENVAGNKGKVVLHFNRKHLTSAGQGRSFSLGMADVSTCEIQLDIGASAIDTVVGESAVDGVGSPAIDAFAPRYTHVDANGKENIMANRLGAITKVRHFTHATSTSGRFEISDLPREMFLQALHLKCPAITGGKQSNNWCNIRDVKLELNGQIVWDMSAVEAKDFLLDHNRYPQKNWYHLDWMLSNELGSQLSLSGLSDFRLILDMIEPAPVVVYPEYWSGIGGI